MPDRILEGCPPSIHATDQRRWHLERRRLPSLADERHERFAVAFGDAAPRQALNLGQAQAEPEREADEDGVATGDELADRIGEMLGQGLVFGGIGKIGALAREAAALGKAESSLAIVQGAVNRANRMSMEDLLEAGVLSERQTIQLLSNPITSPMFRGHMIHNMATRLLREEYGARFEYRPSRGADILDTVTNQTVEIATSAHSGDPPVAGNTTCELRLVQDRPNRVSPVGSASQTLTVPSRPTRIPASDPRP